MAEVYEHNQRASAGYMQIRLTLTARDSLIEFKSASMGTTPIKYEMLCEHRKLSDYHGILLMKSLEQFETLYSPDAGHEILETKQPVNLQMWLDPDAEEDESDYLNWLHMEYIRLPEPHKNLEPPGGGYGIHEWPKTFSLILLIHYAGHWLVENMPASIRPLIDSLEALDKLHFSLLSEPSNYSD